MPILDDFRNDANKKPISKCQMLQKSSKRRILCNLLVQPQNSRVCSLSTRTTGTSLHPLPRLYNIKRSLAALREQPQKKTLLQNAIFNLHGIANLYSSLSQICILGCKNKTNSACDSQIKACPMLSKYS